MRQLILNNDYVLKLEDHCVSWRLLVVENNIEVVCRKERKSALQKFLQQDTGQIFRGRLQLDKYENTIRILIKGQIVGTTDVAEVKNLLSERF